MAIVFPLSAADFFDNIGAQSVTFRRRISHVHAGSGGGVAYTAELAPEIWQGEVKLPAMTTRQAASILALLRYIAGKNGTFHAYHKHALGPAGDPVGATLGAAVVQINAITGNVIKLDGLPVGYAIDAGDRLSFDFGGAVALHEAIEPATAGALGVTGDFTVGPSILPGAAAGAAVRLVKPYCKARIVPGSISEGQARGAKTFGLGFAWEQVLN